MRQVHEVNITRPTETEIVNLLREAQTRFDALTPAEKAEHRRAQRRSWCRGEMMLDDPTLTEEEANRLLDEAGA